ncbi:hypothetical protein G7025_08615 [Pseudomonas lurida]|uniref:hypothetical protein n=1 Tax=Pseudomonas lurida TaxID=244566 RepID=UPI0015E2BEE2|nr:hypothetical protein [Pseudomonas lurida]MBA1293420.1 hypothetical protein [Pseudomonas lurida]
MAKLESPVTEEPAVVVPVPDRQLTFADQVFTSRTLIVPGTDRTLLVEKGVVKVQSSDAQAVSLLKANAEFHLLKE